MHILTLQFTKSAQAQLTELRTKHFPRERNFLEAHITMFHALPPERRDRWEQDLKRACAAQAKFEIEFTEPYLLGRGVAIRVAGQELIQFRERLAGGWRDFLSAQDAQKYRPHCTIQNKVEPVVAKQLFTDLRWQPLTAEATGVSLWKYAGGPWEFDSLLPFRG